MAQRQFNLSKWNRLDLNTSAVFDNPRPRIVKLVVNAPDTTRLVVEQTNEDGEVHQDFLAVFFGRDEIEFGSEGAFTLRGDAPFYLYTADGDEVHFVVADAQSFTEIAEFRPRNPEIELLEFKMRQNMDTLRRELREDYERRLAEGRVPEEPVGGPDAEIIPPAPAAPVVDGAEPPEAGIGRTPAADDASADGDGTQPEPAA